MSEPIALSRDRLSGTNRGLEEDLDLAESPEVNRRKGLSPFWRHFLEMNVAMFVGMGVGYVLFREILAVVGTTYTEVSLRFPELAVLVMGFNMTVPMVAWMRHRGHGWRSSAEMTAAMFLPAIPCIVLLRWHVIVFGAVCGLYCATMIAAMLILMLYRRGEYTAHAMHTGPVGRAMGAGHA